MSTLVAEDVAELVVEETVSEADMREQQRIIDQNIKSAVQVKREKPLRTFYRAKYANDGQVYRVEECQMRLDDAHYIAKLSRRDSEGRRIFLSKREIKAEWLPKPGTIRCRYKDCFAGPFETEEDEKLHARVHHPHRYRMDLEQERRAEAEKQLEEQRLQNQLMQKQIEAMQAQMKALEALVGQLAGKGGKA